MATNVDGMARVTLSATPDTITRFDLLNRPQYIVVTAEGAGVKVAFAGTDAAAIGPDYAQVLAGARTTFRVPNGDRVYIASATASAAVTVEEWAP